jgi:hypothetical protein
MERQASDQGQLVDRRQVILSPDASVLPDLQTSDFRAPMAGLYEASLPWSSPSSDLSFAADTVSRFRDWCVGRESEYALRLKPS